MVLRVETDVAAVEQQRFPFDLLRVLVDPLGDAL
jgi:hypothetical protein